MENRRQRVKRRYIVAIALLAAGCCCPSIAATLPECFSESDSWSASITGTREAMAREGLTAKSKGMPDLNKRYWLSFPRQMDWLMQDNRAARRNPHAIDADLPMLLEEKRDATMEQRLIERVLGQLLGSESTAFRAELGRLVAGKAPAGDVRWLQLYEKACLTRREARLSSVLKLSPRIAFVKRHPVQPSFFGYTEGQSDAQHEAHFNPGSSLCLLEMKGTEGTVTELLADPAGVIRDLDVSWDGKRMLFARKKSRRDDDYHLYEMRADDRTIRQLTSGKGVADYEGRYLANGDLLFSSSRCVQTVDCWWTEVSNLYSCDADGRYMRRLTFDQVHAICPTVVDNGQVVYTRWDYNDRGQVYPQGLFVMNPDGTGQTEYYGNNSWFPTTTCHVRGIPGTDKALAVLMGHHSWQAGKLAVIDRSKGRQEGSGVQLTAPLRENPQADRIDAGKFRTDAYGQDEELFRHPWPLSEHEYITAMTPDRGARRSKMPFMLYYIDEEGNREVLAADPKISCDHPVPLAARKRPNARPSFVDYRNSTGTYFLQDVYLGPGLEGVERGTAAKLRVVAIDYRAAGVGSNRNRGEAGGALVSTPISVGCGCWDVKQILGETPIREDGSAFFTVPARTPVYFQVVDRKGDVIQTMRSWSTLMPGETFSCVGCHEQKSASPDPSKPTLATAAGPRPLEPFHGPERGFSFPKEVQPILDKHCIRCHDGVKSLGEGKPLFSLKGTPFQDKGAKRLWNESYLTLTGAKKGDRTSGNSGRKLVNWIDSQSRPTMLPPYHKGAAKSELMTMLREGHSKTSLSREELEKIAAWIDLGVPYCGDYLEANAWNQGELDKYMRYQRKREALAEEERRNLEALIEKRTGTPFSMPAATPLYEEYLQPGENAQVAR
jgi:hypothetical protein